MDEVREEILLTVVHRIRVGRGVSEPRISCVGEPFRERVGTDRDGVDIREPLFVRRLQRDWDVDILVRDVSPTPEDVRVGRDDRPPPV